MSGFVVFIVNATRSEMKCGKMSYQQEPTRLKMSSGGFWFSMLFSNQELEHSSELLQLLRLPFICFGVALAVKDERRVGNKKEG